MRVTLRQMSAGEAEQIASWRYDGPYAFYDAAAGAAHPFLELRRPAAGE